MDDRPVPPHRGPRPPLPHPHPREDGWVSPSGKEEEGEGAEVGDGGASLRWLSTLMWLIGKSSITGTFASIFVFGAELFPTTLRTLGLGLCSVASKIGGVLAPYIRLAVPSPSPRPKPTIGLPCRAPCPRPCPPSSSAAPPSSPPSPPSPFRRPWGGSFPRTFLRSPSLFLSPSPLCVHC